MTSFSRTRFLAGGVLIGVVLLTLWVLWSRPVPGEVDLRLAGVRQAGNGAWHITVVLTNGTARTLNVVEDVDGNPAFILESGGERRVWLTRMVNQRRLNLSPGGSLTTTVLVTNAPPRFRLKVPLRDLAAEQRDWVGMAIHLLPNRWAERLERRREMPQPTTAWIDAATPGR